MPPIRSKSKAKKPESLIQQAPNAPVFEADSTPLLPLGAMLLAGSLSTAALAQTPASAPVAGTLGTVTVRDSSTTDGAATTSKSQLRATRTEIGKGNQELRDIPQSVTVMTERLIQDRNLDDFRDVLRATAGVTFAILNECVALFGACGLFVLLALRWWKPGEGFTPSPELEPPRALIRAC